MAQSYGLLEERSLKSEKFTRPWITDAILNFSTIPKKVDFVARASEIKSSTEKKAAKGFYFFLAESETVLIRNEPVKGLNLVDGASFGHLFFLVFPNSNLDVSMLNF